MHETESASRSSVDPALAEQNSRVSPTLVAVGIVLALVAVVTLTRLHQISDTPPGIINDEGANGVDALRVLKGEHAIFFAERASGREPMAIYATALATRLFGPSLLAFHLPPALASAGTVLAVFWLGLLLFGKDEDSGKPSPWRALMIAGVGAGLLAASVGQTVVARGAFRANFLPLLLSLCLATLWWGWSRQSSRRGAWWSTAPAGLLAGMIPYTYVSARITPFLFIFFGLTFLIPFHAAARETIRREWPKAVTFLCVAGIVAAPILIYFVLFPDDFFFRIKEVWFTPTNQGNSLIAFVKKVWEHILVFGIRGDPNPKYNLPGRPLFNIWEALFFWIGVGISLLQFRRRPANRLLLIWLGIMLVPGMLAFNRGLGPNSLRMIGAVPASYLIVGVGVWETIQFLKRRFWSENDTGVAIVSGMLVSCLILVQVWLTYRTYFYEWVDSAEYYWAADAEIADAALALNAQPSNATMVFLVPYSLVNGHYGFDYLYQGEAPAHVIHATMNHLPRNVESILAASKQLTVVKVVDWNDDISWIGDGEEFTIALLEKYGKHVGSEQHAKLQIHTYTDLSLDERWSIYEQLEPPIVHYDGGISLMGFAMGHGQEQFAAQQAISIGKERSFWIAFQWQTAPKLNVEYAFSLRLHNSDGVVVYQEDRVLLDQNYSRTDQWAPDQPLDTLYHSEFPADLPSGNYQMRLVVYDFKSLKPTVELGVWEPETTLARLNLAEAE